MSHLVVTLVGFSIQTDDPIDVIYVTPDEWNITSATNPLELQTNPRTLVALIDLEKDVDYVSTSVKVNDTLSLDTTELLTCPENATTEPTKHTIMTPRYASLWLAPFEFPVSIWTLPPLRSLDANVSQVLYTCDRNGTLVSSGSLELWVGTLSDDN